MSWKKEKERLLELRLRWKLWEAVFHRPYGCKNKWCLYKDLGSEKTVIKQELRSLSSPLLSSYRRQKPSKPFYWALVSLPLAEPDRIEWRNGEVCACVYGGNRHLHLQNRSMQSGVTSMVLLSWALTARYFCVPPVGNTAEEIQVSRVHSHWWAFSGPDAHGGEVSEPLTKSLPRLLIPISCCGPVYGTFLEI